MTDKKITDAIKNDWTGNKNSIFTAIGASNHTDKDREQNDYYATSPEAIDKLLSTGVTLPHKIWECACGEGHLSERLKQLGYDVYSSDIIDRGYGKVQDFLATTEMPDDCTCILTNPPYKHATEFVLHALKLLPEGGTLALFLKTTFLEGQKRWERIFSCTPPKYVMPFVRRILCAKNAMFQRMKDGGGSAVSHAWFMWEKGYSGKPLIEWIV